MSRATIPMACSMALASMVTAVIVHQWTVQSVVSKVEAGMKVQVGDGFSKLPVVRPEVPALSGGNHTLASATKSTTKAPVKAGTKNAVATTNSSKKPETLPTDAVSQQQFYQAMLEEMKLLRNENMALRDQMAETNRDLMKLEFRVDTHSASFRPLPTTTTDKELDQPYVEDEAPGVLPNLGTVGNE